MTELITSRTDRLLWLRLNRPGALNALSLEMSLAIETALREAASDDTVRVVAITGEGRAFCSGADLKLHDEDDDSRHARDAVTTAARSALDFLAEFPKPTIAALNGVAVGGGLEFALCCDFVIAARSARVGDAHANYGVVPGGGVTARLPKRIGQARAKYLMFTGEIVPVADLVGTDLILEVVDDDHLIGRVEAVAARIAEKSPLGLRRVKQLVDTGLDQPIRNTIVAERVAAELHRTSEDFREGRRAFAEKRKPDFTGT